MIILRIFVNGLIMAAELAAVVGIADSRPSRPA